MPTINVPAVALPAGKSATLHYTWLQPTESAVEEALGGEGQRAVLQLKVPGDSSSRFYAAASFLEYPVVVQTNGIDWISRQIPYAYQALQPPQGSALAAMLENASGAPLYASRFLSSKGMGPQGQATPANADAGPAPVPIYAYSVFALECSTRNYAILPDSSVPAPNSINAAWLAANPDGPALSQINNTPTGVSANPVYPPNLAGQWAWYAVTALTSDGETQGVAATIAVTPSGLAGGVRFGVMVTWTPIAGALGYRLYRAITTQADDPNGDFTLPQSRVWVAVPLGPLCYGFVHTGTQCGYPGSPPAADSTISPLYNAGTPLPDEGAALAAANGPMTGERYVSRSMDDYVTIVTISKAVMSFPDTLFSLDVGLARTIPYSELEYTWVGVPVQSIPFDTIRQLEACVSLSSFDGYPPWTLLFKGATYRYYRSPLGTWIADVRYRFSTQQSINSTQFVWFPNLAAFNLLPTLSAQPMPLGYQAALEYTGGSKGRYSPPSTYGYRSNLAGQVDWQVLNADPTGAGNFNYRFCSGFAPLFRSR